MGPVNAPPFILFRGLLLYAVTSSTQLFILNYPACHTLPQKQHPSFFKKLPSLYSFKFIILGDRLNNGRNRLLHQFSLIRQLIFGPKFYDDRARIIESKKNLES